MSEMTLYQDPTVVVTSASVTFGAITYTPGALRGVEVAQLRPDRKAAVALFAVALVCLFLSATQIAGFPYFAAFLLCLLLSVGAWFIPKVRYAVRIHTANGVFDVLVSQDMTRVTNVVQAVAKVLPR